MVVRLAYGKKGLPVELRDDIPIKVIEPIYVTAVKDPVETVTESLRNPVGTKPLRHLVKPRDSVGIVFSDITRPTPNHILIPSILKELELAGVPSHRITLFNSTGTHRLNTEEELVSMLGQNIVRTYRIVQNDARALDQHEVVGKTRRGTIVKIHREFLHCSFKILTGFIEPHFFAGFSGGGKAVMPGMAHLDTVMRNHDAQNIDHPGANWGMLEGNPLREEIDEAASLAKPNFLVNVTLNKDKQITASFAGDWIQAYREGVNFVRRTAMVRTDTLYDLVITSNAGYPLDLNLYQAVKGMSAAAKITKPGGTIVVAAECWDGVPEHGSFGRLLREAKNPDELLKRIRSEGFRMDDQWQAQILALLVKKARIFVYSTYLSEVTIRQCHLEYCPSIETLVEEMIREQGPAIKICVLLEGPLTIPYYEP
ncbi:MAG: nickel-dependent lactate racemase [Spirochaetes bacterium]|nr:nickel-dependent lactate racemase [Spirochaetota bacterium]